MNGNTSPTQDKYFVRTEPIENQPGVMNSLLVKIFQRDDDDEDRCTQLGSYTRNYHALFATWCPFEQGGEDYALISRDYVGTSVLHLPDCGVIAEEEMVSTGFCPVEFWVPWEQPFGREIPVDGTWGLVAGCVWGEDFSWKVRFVDLSHITTGDLQLDDRFGYLELPANVRLRDAVSVLGDSGYLEIATAIDYHFRTGRPRRLPDP